MATQVQGVGLSFRILLITSIIGLSACSSGPMSRNVIVHNQEKQVINNSFSLAYRIIEDIRWNLPERSTHLHNKGVVMALKRAQNGEMVEWFDEQNDAYGSTKILLTHNNGNGWCRLAETDVKYKENHRKWVYKACTANKGVSWTMVQKFD